MRLKVGALVVFAATALAGTNIAVAQNAPPAPPGAAQILPRRVTDSAFALQGAYREIGRAENAGATGHYIDAARTHYRSAIGRHDRSDDTGAAAEARLASDLARVAIDERPPNAPSGPKDIPAPPTARPGPAGRSMDGPTPIVIDGMLRGLPGGDMMEHGPMLRAMHGAMFFGHHGFDATALAEMLKVETGPEARQLAQNAVDANTAAQKAALAGNVAEASRQSRLSNDLAAAVHDLAMLNHPELARHTMDVRVFNGTEITPH